MNHPAIEKARLKVQWANRYIQEFDAKFKTFRQQANFGLRIYRDGDGIQCFEGSAPDTPIVFALLIGDAIHNLRASLDHFTSGVVGLESRTAYFPFHGTVEQFDACAKKRLINEKWPGLGDHIVSELKPYEAGNYPLWALNKLDVIDKHKLIIPAIGLAQIRTGALVDKERNNHIAGMTLTVGEGGRLVGIATDGNFEIEGEVETFYDIFFPKGSLFEGEPVLKTLANLSQVVDETFTALERFMSANP